MAKSTSYNTSQDWLEQSALLLRARPTTTRITTKYTCKPLGVRTAARAAPGTTKHAFLTLKTFDPVSGATLKYKTNKAAEVSRLVSSLGTLGRDMAGLPEVAETTEVAEGVTETTAGKENKKEAPTGGKKKGKKGKK